MQRKKNRKKKFNDSIFHPQELQSFEVPQLITLVDESKGDNQICVGYKNQFDLINEKNGDTLQLYSVDNNKVRKQPLDFNRLSESSFIS